MPNLTPKSREASSKLFSIALTYGKNLILLTIILLLAGCVTTQPQKAPTTAPPPQKALPILPEDADLTQVQRQLHLIQSERYLTRDGDIKTLPVKYEQILWSGKIEKVKVDEYTQEEEGRILIPIGTDEKE